MLLYYDPMDLISIGAPYDEHDQYISQVAHLATTPELLQKGIFDLFKEYHEHEIEYWERKSLQMTNDLLEFIERSKKVKIEVRD